MCVHHCGSWYKALSIGKVVWYLRKETLCLGEEKEEKKFFLGNFSLFLCNNLKSISLPCKKQIIILLFSLLRLSLPSPFRWNQKHPRWQKYLSYFTYTDASHLQRDNHLFNQNVKNKQLFYSIIFFFYLKRNCF